METAESLSRLLNKLGSKSPKTLTRDEVRDLPQLYRRLVSELSEARARGASARSLGEKEALVVRAHAILYAPEPSSLRTSFLPFLMAFPSAVYRARYFVALATFLLAVGTAWGYVEQHRDPSSAAVLLPTSLQENAEQSFQEGKQVRKGDPIYGVFYFTNNTQVALNCYALGATFGVGTTLSLLFNGVVLGTSFAIVQQSASPRAFFSFVLPHGGVELAAIVIAAAGGLRMADAMLRPGFRRRRDAFKEAALESLPLALGSGVLLMVAGLVEGWISPMPWTLGAKAAIGGVLDVGLAAYLFFGRKRERNEKEGAESEAA